MGRSTITLTPPLTHLLLSLAEGPRHGYALLTDVTTRSGGRIRLGPSSLYHALTRLEQAGLIRDAEQPKQAADHPHVDQRRYFAITAAGRAALRAEVALLSDIVDRAKAISLGQGR